MRGNGGNTDVGGQGDSSIFLELELQLANVGAGN